MLQETSRPIIRRAGAISLERALTEASASPDDVLDKARFQVGAIDPSRDEYNSRPVVGVGPGVELHRRVENVVDAVDNHRHGFINQGEDTLDAQQILAHRASHSAEP